MTSTQDNKKMKKAAKLLLLITFIVISFFVVKDFKRKKKKKLAQQLRYSEEAIKDCATNKKLGIEFLHIDALKENKSVFFSYSDEKNKLKENKLNFQSKDQGFFKIENGYVFGNDGYVATKNKKYIYETIECLSSAPVLSNSGLDNIHNPRVYKLTGTAFVIAGPWSCCYFHWMMDTLPRLKLLNYINEKIDYFCVPSQRCKFQTESLDTLKVPLEKIIYLNNDLYSFDNIIVSSISSFNNYHKPDIFYSQSSNNIEFIKKDFQDCYTSKEGRKKIYITRKNANHRKLINENEIWACLEKLGFKEIIAEDLSLKEQAKLFYSAEVVVSIHGAGLTNIIHCSPKTKVVEILPQDAFNASFPKNREFHLYPSICKILDLEHYFVCGSGEVNCDPNRPLRFLDDVYVSSEELIELIRSFDQE